MSADETLQPPTSAKEELQRLVGVLSEHECWHLMSAVKDVAAGERFWESDVGIFYNEYIKTRYFNVSRNPDSIIPAGLATEEGIFAPIPLVKSYPEAVRVQLPPPTPLNATLTELLLHRRSRRDYTDQAISLVELSTLLEHACGTTGSVPAYGYNRVSLRTFPSSGGLQVPEVYLFVQAIEDVSPGLYHYHPADRALELLKPGNYWSTLRDLAPGQPYIETSAVVFAITGYYERLRWKYGSRAYRYMCMDTGFLGENLHLVAEGLALGVCAIAGFVDDALEELLGIDGQDEMALLLVSVGVLESGKKESNYSVP